MTTNLYSIWHLNLLYSSIEIDRRKEVIEKCFWPLLNLAKLGFKIGIEIPASSLEIAYELDPKWVEEFKHLIATKSAELVGSGYTQLIAPITKYDINKANIEEGIAIYSELLNCVPEIWLINEQAYSESLISLYKEFKQIKAIVIDWSALYGNNSDLSENLAYSHHELVSSNGETIPVLWSNSIAFQKFQHVIHQQINSEEYFIYIQKILNSMKHANLASPLLCIYGNDAEIFDFRPGRFHTEASISNAVSEWETIINLLKKIQEYGFNYILPTETLSKNKEAITKIITTHFNEPVTVKKQPKYNVTRWALTGRNSPRINQQCLEIFHSSILNNSKIKREICYLLSSDFRTHITEKRWDEYQERLSALHSSLEIVDNLESNDTEFYSKTDSLIFSDDHLNCTFNSLKGMTIEKLGLKDKPYLFGKVPHGHFSRMDMCSDWYTGNTVFQPPGKSQATDLQKTDILVFKNNNSTSYKSLNKFLDGTLEKKFEFLLKQSSWVINYQFNLTSLPIGSLRFCYLTFNPDEIDKDNFELKSHAGGLNPAIYTLPQSEFNHGENPTNVVSSNNMIPMTENFFTVKTKSYELKVEILSASHLPGLMAKYKKAKEGPLFRLFFSFSEYDETRKNAWDFNNAHIKLKFTLQSR